MSETIRVTREPDFFPLSAGLRLDYQLTSTEFAGTESVRVVIESVDAFRDDARARVLLTRSRGGTESQVRYAVRRGRREIVSEGGVLGLARREFPLPALVGKTWVEEPDRHEIASREASIAVPAGNFKNCLRVNVFLAGGDAGSAIRYYAPGVGYVYEEYSGEAWGARVQLIAFEFPRPAR
ncbi:MAG TPA: hypothetical protein VNI01_03965 [Elusimicrobiota bacterium]|nr:hypothetical protein [Elusimicrobiota bacterium]